jgi:hypothetical protein
MIEAQLVGSFLTQQAQRREQLRIAGDSINAGAIHGFWSFSRRIVCGAMEAEQILV